MSLLLVNANALQIPLADGSVQCAVTSPPYFSLRDYGVAGQIGLESNVNEYTEKLVNVFREVKRVLRDDGTLWLNLGDSYNGSGGAGGDYNEGGLHEGQPRYPGHDVDGLKPKDLIGVPWRVAFALQADGWTLRSDIVWSKPNPMPESVTDRPTKSHEYVFLLSKNARYFYDADAVREPAGSPITKLQSHHDPDNPKYQGAPHERWLDQFDGRVWGELGSRNRRSVWNIATCPTPLAHFATYPPALVEPCIKAGTSEAGRCPTCGKAWERVVEKPFMGDGNPYSYDERKVAGNKMRLSGRELAKVHAAQDRRDKGFAPACACPAHTPVPCVVFDPFAGSGTTLLVARKLGRHAVGTDLSMTYLTECARERLSLNALDEWGSGARPENTPLSDLPMFAEGNP